MPGCCCAAQVDVYTDNLNSLQCLFGEWSSCVIWYSVLLQERETKEKRVVHLGWKPRFVNCHHPFCVDVSNKNQKTKKKVQEEETFFSFVKVASLDICGWWKGILHSFSLFPWCIYTNNLRHRVSTCLYSCWAQGTLFFSLAGASKGRKKEEEEKVFFFLFFFFAHADVYRRRNSSILFVLNSSWIRLA